MSDLRCQRASYTQPRDAEAIVSLMRSYALDPMGGGEPLAAAVAERLCPALAEQGGAYTIIAWQGEQAIGLINAFAGFSTFKAAPLLNIHDIIVLPPWRRRGVCRAMLAAVESLARELGCCKLTLEVLEGNSAARRSYLDYGFVDYRLRPEYGSARFMEKPLAGAQHD